MSAGPAEEVDDHVLDFLPCPRWCDGHPDGEGIHDGWEMSVHHVARTGWRLRATSPHLWPDDWRGPVCVERMDTYHDGKVTIGAPTIDFNVNELDCMQDVVDMMGDLLVAGLILREALE